MDFAFITNRSSPIVIVIIVVDINDIITINVPCMSHMPFVHALSEEHEINMVEMCLFFLHVSNEILICCISKMCPVINFSTQYTKNHLQFFHVNHIHFIDF